MSTKLISVLLILLFIWGGYRLYVYYQRIEEERWIKEKTSGETLDPTKLEGLSYNLEDSLRRAQEHGAKALGAWLDAYGQQVGDPRKAWIQLDYCTLLARDNPQEARKVFAEVDSRTSPDSPVYPRLTQLKKSFQ